MDPMDPWAWMDSLAPALATLFTGLGGAAATVITVVKTNRARRRTEVFDEFERAVHLDVVVGDPLSSPVPQPLRQPSSVTRGGLGMKDANVRARSQTRVRARETTTRGRRCR